jgi:hypothetical protein
MPTWREIEAAKKRENQQPIEYRPASADAPEKKPFATKEDLINLAFAFLFEFIVPLLILAALVGYLDCQHRK